MIQMVKGTYGRMANGRVEPMTKHSGPFSLSEAREAELVKAGVAVKVEASDQANDYNRMKMAELRKAAAAAGVDAEKAKAAKSKKELIGLLEAAAKPAPGSGKSKPVGFKEQLQKDLDSVFFNLDEFAEIHRVEGKKIPVVVDSDQLNKLKKGQILGLIEADMLLMGKEADFPANLEPGRLLNVDGREMLVANSGRDLGLVEVALRQNRTG